MSKALRLSDLPEARTLDIACRRCPRVGRLRVRMLRERYGDDTALPDVANALSADCPQHGKYGGCFVHFTDLVEVHDQ